MVKLGTVYDRRRSIITLLGKQALVKRLYVMVKVMATLMAKLMAKPTPVILADLNRDRSSTKARLRRRSNCHGPHLTSPCDIAVSVNLVRLSFWPERNSVAVASQAATQVHAGLTVRDLVPVANVLTGLRAEVPDRLLDVPGKGGRKGRVELPGVNPVCHLLDDLDPAKR